jgi:hypothetical protein
MIGTMNTTNQAGREGATRGATSALRPRSGRG